MAYSHNQQLSGYKRAREEEKKDPGITVHLPPDSTVVKAIEISTEIIKRISAKLSDDPRVGLIRNDIQRLARNEPTELSEENMKDIQKLHKELRVDDENIKKMYKELEKLRRINESLLNQPTLASSHPALQEEQKMIDTAMEQITLAITDFSMATATLDWKSTEAEFAQREIFTIAHIAEQLSSKIHANPALMELVKKDTKNLQHNNPTRLSKDEVRVIQELRADEDLAWFNQAYGRQIERWLQSSQSNTPIRWNRY